MKVNKDSLLRGVTAIHETLAAVVNDAEMAFMPADFAVHRQDANAPIMQAPSTLTADGAASPIEAMPRFAAVQEFFRVEDGERDAGGENICTHVRTVMRTGGGVGSLRLAMKLVQPRWVPCSARRLKGGACLAHMRNSRS